MHYIVCNLDIKKEVKMFEHVWSEETLGWIIAPQGNLPSPEILKDADLYFVWGNLMNPAFVRGVLGHAIPFAPAVLKGYRRVTFLKDGKRDFDLIPTEKDVVLGVVLISPSEEDIVKLDTFEQVPTVMVKCRVGVMTGDLFREVSTYMRV
jgi:hypothetical protein